ncbi:hypothetical protein D3C87_1071610 [compost metagenome]
MPYSPEWKGPIEGWTANFVAAHMWKVERTQQRADVMQEAYLVFMKVSRRYPELDDPRHFMALYKTSWTRRFTDLANADTADRVTVGMGSTAPGEDGEQEREFVGVTDNDGTLAVLIRQAPAEVKQVINLFLSAPQEILDVALAGWTGKRDERYATGGSRRLCRLLGLPDDLDVMDMVERYFRG